METGIKDLMKYLVTTINGEIEWKVSYNDDGEINAYNCYSIDEDTFGLKLIINEYNLEFFVYKMDGSRKVYVDGDFIYTSDEDEDRIKLLKSQVTKEEIEIVRAIAKAVETIIRLPELEIDAKNGTWEDDEVSLERILRLIEGTIDGVVIWEERNCQSNTLNIEHRLFHKYNFEVTGIRMFQSTTTRNDDGYINIFYDFYKTTIHGLEHCCVLIIEDVENGFVYFKEVTNIGEYRQARALYTLSKVIYKYYLVNNKNTFGNIMVQLLEYARSKRNVLTLDDVDRYLVGYEVSVEECERLYTFLENNNVDVLSLNEDVQFVNEIEEEGNKATRKGKYETESERLAARKASREKYRKKLNLVNEYSWKNTIEAAEKEQYSYVDEYEDREDIMRTLGIQSFVNGEKDMY